MNRLKLAELTSAVGALAVGVGLGALFARLVGPAAGLITFAGLTPHAFGMWDKHRLEAVGHPGNPRWIVVLYGVCWLLLAAVLGFLLLSNRT